MIKKILFLFLIASLAACRGASPGTVPGERERELEQELARKDSLLNEVFYSLSTIAGNLDNIKEREGILSSRYNDPELPLQPDRRISEDIEQLDLLLLNNRHTISNLRRNIEELSRTSGRLGALEQYVAEITRQVEERDDQIATLKSHMESISLELGESRDRLEQATTEAQQLAGEREALRRQVETTTELLNTAYYIVGSRKELTDKNIVSRSGFIGGSFTINSARNLDGFTRVDIRDFNEIIVNRKNVTVVSSHPSGSYQLLKDSRGVVEKMVITDRERFWEDSKVLVLLYK